ncbi:hypothetical protein [Streptomyces sp. CBMA123]|uniref:hypothetical protein n=1 Tax=Streptomyces sp. CBMA123 TaxID=1896313 RepID=UPI001661AB36|nr:hypothetical protein [Streptomyces sp. CBMA123]MBD0688511.1 hypothetical protein [Streptomyces sp. CBMA123]
MKHSSASGGQHSNSAGATPPDLSKLNVTAVGPNNDMLRVTLGGPHVLPVTPSWRGGVAFVLTNSVMARKLAVWILKELGVGPYEHQLQLILAAHRREFVLGEFEAAWPPEVPQERPRLPRAALGVSRGPAPYRRVG